MVLTYFHDEEQEEKSNQDLLTMKRYQDRYYANMMGDFCWMLNWKTSNTGKRKLKRNIVKYDKNYVALLNWD